MARSKDTFKNGHFALATWANWKIQEMTDDGRSPLGYPSQTSESKCGIRSGTYGPISPDDAAPRHILKTQQAVATMPEELQGVVKLKYLCDNTDKERVNIYREDTGKGK